MDTLKIKAFLLAEKYKSLSKAAEEFSYTPSAFSHIMDSLEAELGVKLLKRTHQGVELTKNGQKMKEKFEKLLEAEKAVYDTAAVIRKERENTLRIGTYPSVAIHLLPELLNGFKQRYPLVKTSILIDDQLSDWLKNDIADVVFSDIGQAQGTSWYPLMEDPYVAVVSEKLFSNRKVVRREELYEYIFIQTNEGKLKEYFDYDRFPDVVSLTSSEDASVISLVRENIGVAVLPELSMRKHPKDIRMVRLAPKTARMLGLSCTANQHSQAADLFIQYVNEVYSHQK